MYFTGSKEHNVRLRSIALSRGWSLNEYAFSAVEGKKPARIPSCSSEEQIYKALGLSYVEPELREDAGEIETAQEGPIPALIGRDDIRGTFHCHTTWSDGTASVRAMADAAKAAGWEYLGIADHSKVAVYARGLSLKDLKAQFKEIDEVNASNRGFTIFKGTEVDILPDGSLDWDDKTLESFDYVVASIHSKFGMTQSEATARLVRAIRHPSVTMLGHMTGRLLLGREGYPVDVPEVIRAAAGEGKVIELNANPKRFDIDWRWIRQARDKGVMISINPDAHSTGGLLDTWLGVNIARKGWLRPGDVLNTRGTGEVKKWLGL
jgi:DNA polymerase (family 10)